MAKINKERIIVAAIIATTSSIVNSVGHIPLKID